MDKKDWQRGAVFEGMSRREIVIELCTRMHYGDLAVMRASLEGAANGKQRHWEQVRTIRRDIETINELIAERGGRTKLDRADVKKEAVRV